MNDILQPNWNSPHRNSTNRRFCFAAAYLRIRWQDAHTHSLAISFYLSPSLALSAPLARFPCTRYFFSCERVHDSETVRWLQLDEPHWVQFTRFVISFAQNCFDTIRSVPSLYVRVCVLCGVIQCWWENIDVVFKIKRCLILILCRFTAVAISR